MLFISHSSKDLQIVSALVNLIRSSLTIPPEEIRCTSLDGYRLSGGVPIHESLRQEVHEAEAFIGLISYHSLQSTYVAFELGARWGANKNLIPLLAPGFNIHDLKAPLTALNTLSCENAAHLHQLVRELADKLQVKLNPPDRYQQKIDETLALPRISKMIIPEYLLKELEIDFSTRKDRIPGSQREILEYMENETKRRESIPQRDFEVKFGHKVKSVYWRLESLCYLGFISKEVTDHRDEKPTYNYKLTKEYKASIGL